MPAETVLLTGCAGFIGSHTAVRLLDAGCHVVGLDNLNDYYSPARKRSNLEELRRETRNPENFHFVEGDLRDKELLATLFKTHPIRRIIHLAAMAGVRNSIEMPALYFDINLLATLNLLDAARDHQVTNFVFASTSSVYGDTKVIPFVETDSCDRPLAPYPASKRAAEMLGFSYHHLHKLNFTALRFFTVYGPRGRPDMMAYKVLDSIFYGQKIPLYKGGEMFRDWTYVGDIVSGIVAAAERPLGYAVINIGAGKPVKLSEFVKMVEQQTGRTAELIDAPMQDADIAYTCADISRARELLGYQPQMTVEEGVRNFWEWYRGAVLESRVL